MSTPEEPTGVTAENFDLFDWIETGTVARRHVEIHNDPSLVEEYQALERELKAAEKAADSAGEDAALDDDGDSPQVTDVIARMEALWQRWEASKSVWTVRAVSQDEVEATYDPEKGGVPVPPAPIPLPEKAGAKAHADFVRKVNAHQRQRAEAEAERRLVLLSIAVETVETPQGTANGVTVDQLKRLRGRPHGQQWIERLYKAMSEATEGDTDIPRPTSPERSTTRPA